MADTFTHNLGLRQKAVGSMFTANQNNWGSLINHDLELIDKTIGDLCGEYQIAAIRERLRGKLKFLGGPI